MTAAPPHERPSKPTLAEALDFLSGEIGRRERKVKAGHTPGLERVRYEAACLKVIAAEVHLASKEPDEVAKHLVAVLRQQYADADLGKLRFRISPEAAVALVKQALVAHAEKQLREQKGD